MALKMPGPKGRAGSNPAARTTGCQIFQITSQAGAACLAGIHRLADIAARTAEDFCDGRLLIVQEGGYNPAYTGYCAYATALGFLGRPLDLPDPLAYYPEDPALAEATVAALIARHPLLDAQGQWHPGRSRGGG